MLLERPLLEPIPGLSLTWLVHGWLVRSWGEVDDILGTPGKSLLPFLSKVTLSILKVADRQNLSSGRTDFGPPRKREGE